MATVRSNYGRWTKEAFELLVSSKAEGLLSPAIQERLRAIGHDFTCRSIRAKLHRVKLGQTYIQERPKIVHSPVWIDDDVIGIPMVDLESHQCRWPVKDGLYCGQDRTGRSYCRVHCERAYRN